MKIVMLTNLKSGRGKAAQRSDHLERLLNERGHGVGVFSVSELKSDERGTVFDFIKDAHRVVVVGGDGSVHHQLADLSALETPMYHLGTGTANLICKEFGMSRSPDKALVQLEMEIEPTRVDVPTANGLPFLIMVSLGIDASVIHRFQDFRAIQSGAGGGYMAYRKPVFQELFSPRPANYQVDYETESGAESFAGRGMLVVSNMHSYGGKFNPNPQARCDDGVLDAVSIPCSSSISCAYSFAFLKLGLNRQCFKRAVSNKFVIGSTGDASRVQVDGEKGLCIEGLADGILRQDQEIVVEIGKQSLLIHSPRVGRNSRKAR